MKTYEDEVKHIRDKLLKEIDALIAEGLSEGLQMNARMFTAKNGSRVIQLVVEGKRNVAGIFLPAQNGEFIYVPMTEAGRAVSGDNK